MTASGTTIPPAFDIRQNRRMERYRALRWLWRNPQFLGDEVPNDRGWVAPVTKVSTCQRHSINPDGSVKVLVTPTPDGPRAGFKGLMTCGSVWVCPVCSNKIAQVRAQEIADAVDRWHASGGFVVMVTLTMRHHDGQDLADLWGGLSYAWNQASSGQGWRADQDRYGTMIGDKMRVPWVRAVEATHGRNGWHLHVHALLFLRGDVDADALGKSMFQRWRSGLITKGFAAPIATSGGLDVKRIDVTPGGCDPAHALGGYFTKNTYSGDSLSVGMEATRGGHKKGRAGGRAPFQLLESIVLHLDDADDPTAQRRAMRDVALWREWERVSKGKRQLTWSRGLRDWLRLDDERSDDDIASEVMETDETVIAQHYRSPREFAPARRDLAGVLHDAEIWYTDVYVPAVASLPGLAEHWRRPWKRDKVGSRARS